MTLSFLFIFGFSFTGLNGEASKNQPNVQKMEQKEAPNIFYDKEFGEYFDTESEGYIEVYQVKDGEVDGKVDMDEYIERQATESTLENDNNDTHDESADNPKAEPAAAPNYSYTESSSNQRVKYGSRASIIQKNPGPGSDTQEIGYSYTQGHSYGVSIGSGAKSAVKSGASFTWSNSEEVSSSHEMSIPSGYQGYWRFDPLVNTSNGVVKKFIGSEKVYEKDVKAQSPVKLGNHLDGELVSVKEPL